MALMLSCCCSQARIASKYKFSCFFKPLDRCKLLWYENKLITSLTSAAAENSDTAGATSVTVTWCLGLRQWWACCPGSRLTSGGRCSCTGPGRCEPPAQQRHYQTHPGLRCCSRAASVACSPSPAGAGSSAHWSVVQGRHNSKKQSGSCSFLFGNTDLQYDWRDSPARWSACSWRCWGQGAPLQNTGSLLDLGQEPDPPGTAEELENTKENKCFKGFCSYRFRGIPYLRHSDA